MSKERRSEALIVVAIVVILATLAWIGWGVYGDCRSAGHGALYCVMLVA